MQDSKAETILTTEEKTRIVKLLNKRYKTSVPLEVMEFAVKVGLSSWAGLKKEADSA